MSWKDKVAKKKVEVAAKLRKDWQLPDSLVANISETSTQSVIDIPRTCGLLNKKELEITENYDATDLVNKMAARELTSVEVTTAFCKRAAIAQQLTFCLTETFFDMAMERAQKLDEHLAKTGKTVGPLHGLPISVKDSLNIKGIHSTIGFVSFIDNPPAAQNSPLIDILLDAGAVLYTKTNLPQTIMSADSHNWIFGRTLNPYNLSLSAGGSSGGEGAIVAMRASPLGIGTDIAGSIRIPSICCGIFGFKPCAGRVPYGGQTSAGRPGSPGFGPSAGPMTNSARDAELLLKTVFNSKGVAKDELAVAVPWIEPEAKTTLTIGLIPEDAAFPLHPPMQRTIQSVAAKLRAAGHNVVDLSGKFPSIGDIATLAMRYFRMDPDNFIFTHIDKSGEPRIPSLYQTFPDDGAPPPELRELWNLNVKRRKAMADMRQVFVENKLDVLLGPAYPGVAPPHDLFGTPAYTVMYNLVDYPACVLPVNKADKKADAAFVRDVKYVPAYDADAIEGAPCHIQLAARNLKEESLLRSAILVEKVLKG